MMTASTVIGAPIGVPSYPMSVLRGCASIDEVEAFRDLPDGFIRVVMRLIKKIDVMTPEKAIFARRETLAREAGKSCETVGRALRWLEDQGFISRNQVTRKFLRGSDSHICPTAKMIEALGFGQQNTKSATQTKTQPSKASSNNEPAVRNDGSLSALQNQEINIHKQSGEPGETVDKVYSTTPVSKGTGKTVKIQGKSLPTDLAWLVEEGRLKATAVLCLMKLAKESGKLLSDVVAVTKPYLRKMSGHGLFAYMRTLIQQEKDYKFIAQQQTAKAGQKVAQEQFKELVTRKAHEWIGRRFKARNGDREFMVEKDGYLATFVNGKLIAAEWINEKFVEAVQEGRLVMCTNEG